jgi:hypothetical protein
MQSTHVHACIHMYVYAYTHIILFVEKIQGILVYIYVYICIYI